MARRFTTARWAALKWFVDHEGDPDAMLMRKHPSRKMLAVMLDAGQAAVEKTSLENQQRVVLTDKGRADHYGKFISRKRKAMSPAPPQQRSR
jgi:hypothetical protein